MRHTQIMCPVLRIIGNYHQITLIIINAKIIRGLFGEFCYLTISALIKLDFVSIKIIQHHNIKENVNR